MNITKFHSRRTGKLLINFPSATTLYLLNRILGQAAYLAETKLKDTGIKKNLLKINYPILYGISYYPPFIKLFLKVVNFLQQRSKYQTDTYL